MNVTFEHLKPFFEQIKRAGFWQRLFRWKEIRQLSYDAYEEYSGIAGLLERLQEELNGQKEQIRSLEQEREIRQSRIEDFRVNTGKLEDRIKRLEEDLSRTGRRDWKRREASCRKNG